MECSNIMELRKIFDDKVNKIMEKYDFVDIDEGEFEAITEASRGIFYLFREDGRAYVFGYTITNDCKDVKIFSLWDFEG